MSALKFLNANGHALAYRHSPGQSREDFPGVFFLGGFNSSMQGLKAKALEAHCQQTGCSFTRFDYRGHGRSSGNFADACIGDWIADASAIFNATVAKPRLIVGSSMGAWIGAHLALASPEHVRGFIGVASAIDFTKTLETLHLNESQRKQINEHGATTVPSCYADEAPYTITAKLIDEAKQHLLLDSAIALSVPVCLIHGTDDADVPWQTSIKFAQRVTSSHVSVTLVKHGDHRLSSPENLDRLCKAVARMQTLVGNTN